MLIKGNDRKRTVTVCNTFDNIFFYSQQTYKNNHLVRGLGIIKLQIRNKLGEMAGLARGHMAGPQQS